jgi:hypothetical protein
MKSIEIIVAPDGKTTVQTKGFTGPECREASRFVEQALGARNSETLTAEFHQAQPVRQDQGQQT